VLSGILRLSAKYDVEHLRQRCLRHLSDIYPTTLKAWDLLGYSRDIISFCAPPKVYPVFQKCNTELLQLAQFVAENWSACHFPLEIWEEHDWEEVASDLCAECVRQCRKAHAKARQEFWNRMPAIFSLNSVWDELERLKEAALKS
jgi:hypothetical protein